MKKILEHRPWGNFEQFTHNESTTVKIITVEQGESLSLQYHNHREEFWRILQGNPTLEIGGKQIEAKPGDEFFVNTKESHRISAPHGTAAFLEIAFGNFDENDIVRLEDKYGRIQ